MESAYELTLDNPIKKANWFSKMCFGHLTPIFQKGKTRNLEISDLYRSLEHFDSCDLGNRLELLWQNEIAKAKKRQPSLARCIYKLVGLEYIGWGLMFFVYTMLTNILPLLLASLIQQFSKQSNKTSELCLTSILLMLVTLASSFFHHHSVFGMLLCSMKVRAAISALLYQKILKLNQSVLGRSTSAGQIINLLSNDLSRIDIVFQYLHIFWILPIQVAIICYLIWRQVGISALAGILSMAMFSIPVQGYLSKLIGVLRLKVSEKTDKRIKLMTEIVSGIQVIKMYTWEKPFERLVHLIRKSEVSSLTKSSYLNGVYTSSVVFLERVSLFSTVLCYVLLGNGLTPDKVFSMAQLFNVLQVSAAIYYPMAVSSASQSWVSVKRLQHFLDLEEKEEPRIEKCSEGIVSLNDVSAAWIKGVTVLKNITLHLKPGTLCAVVGPVGSGKSSIIQILLGELPLLGGTAKVGEEIAYASQQPWLFSATVRQNILFGQMYDRKRYKKVTKVCALRKDFKQLPYGDQTVVGDKGASLSGGQRARISLARAVYRKAKIYLLDDPLSAVDAPVGKHLFNECIHKYLRGTLRILVTHQLQYLMKADVVVVVNKGEIEAVGTYNELSSNNLEFSKLLKHQEIDDETDKEAVAYNEKPGVKDSTRSSTRSTTSSVDSTTSDICEAKQVDDHEAETVNCQIKSPLKQYVEACGNNFLILALLFVLMLSQVLCSGADFWIAFWTNQEEMKHSSASFPLRHQEINNETVHVHSIHPSDLHSYAYQLSEDTSKMSQQVYSSQIYDEYLYKNQTYYFFKSEAAVSVYGLLILMVILFTVARSLMFFKMCMLSSVNLHRRMFASLLKAPIRFFNTNPSGRILNRFSKDMGAVDDLLSTSFVLTVQVMLVMTGILVNVCVANYYQIIAVIILGCAIAKIYDVFITAAKDLKHLEGITKSPVFTHINSTISGLATVRTCKIEKVLIRQFGSHQDVNTSAWWLIAAIQTALGIWIDAICVAFIACISFSFVILHSASKSTNGSMVGLALSQASILTGMVQYGLRQVCDVIGHLTSVERILQYTLVEPEEYSELPQDKLPAESWPSRGEIEFKNLHLRYDASEPDVLKGLSFTIYGAEKIGVVGRTGAGKSSLIAAIFRLAPLQGAIYIDGVDTQQISLINLRKRISIIPQEPVLFSASLRYNLDPFGEFQDSEVWRALEEVELKLLVPSLDFMVSEGGGNFSTGERQLICLARAILRDNRILIMDEATANVDQRTDSFIQDTIRRRFKNCTVITIAHRLNTIMDSDRVMVMSSGNLLEFDHPHKLLQIPDGHFHKMVLETGQQMAMELKDLAMEAYHKKHNE